MHSLPALAASVRQARPLAVPFTDLTFRSIHLRHFSNFGLVKPLFSAAAGAAGSRYVPPNGPPALYAALDADTEHREGNQVFCQAANSPAGPALLRAGGLRPTPSVLIGVHVRASRILDFRDDATRLRLGIQAIAELLGPWRGVPNAPTQVLDEAVFKDGRFEGLLFPSAQNGGRDCVVLFPARLQRPSRVDFYDLTTNLAAQLP